MENEVIKIREKLNKEVGIFIKKVETDQHFPASKKNITYAEFLTNRMLIVLAIKEGIPFSIFNLIQHLAPFSENEWANYLDLSTKSLQRYRQTKRSFKSIHSEKIIEMAEVTNLGIEVFGSFEKFKLWLETPVFALGNLKPMELLNDSYGKEMLIGELIRIEHGIFA